MIGQFLDLRIDRPLTLNEIESLRPNRITKWIIQGRHVPIFGAIGLLIGFVIHADSTISFAWHELLILLTIAIFSFLASFLFDKFWFRTHDYEGEDPSRLRWRNSHYLDFLRQQTNNEITRQIRSFCSRGYLKAMGRYDLDCNNIKQICKYVKAVQQQGRNLTLIELVLIKKQLLFEFKDFDDET